jgi:intein-encoded DNA endonuclease-like protein
MYILKHYPKQKQQHNNNSNIQKIQFVNLLHSLIHFGNKNIFTNSSERYRLVSLDEYEDDYNDY